MISSQSQAAPTAAFASVSYALDERTFEALPRDHPKRVRHREVERFRRDPLYGGQPRWNASVLDEAHKFPERPIMHCLAVPGDAQVVRERFPEIVPNTSRRRALEQSRGKSLSANKLRNSRLIVSDPALIAEKEPKMSYLSNVIARDFTEEKMLQRRGWCSSTLTTTATHPHRRWKEAVDYVELNKTKYGVVGKDKYVAPQKRVSQLNESIREWKKQNRAQAEEQRLLSETHKHPAVFKMSNIDEWWLLDPTLTDIPADPSPDDVQDSLDDE